MIITPVIGFLPCSQHYKGLPSLSPSVDTSTTFVLSTSPSYPPPSVWNLWVQPFVQDGQNRPKPAQWRDLESKVEFYSHHYHKCSISITLLIYLRTRFHSLWLTIDVIIQQQEVILASSFPHLTGPQFWKFLRGRLKLHSELWTR